MFSKSRSALTMLFAAGYLAQAILLGVAHHHRVDHCAGGSHCITSLRSGCADRSRWQNEHSECGYGKQHSCTPNGDQSAPEPNRRPAHNQDKCAICHYLAAPTISVQLVDFDQVTEVVVTVEPVRPDLYSILPIRKPFPRGPPAGNC